MTLKIVCTALSRRPECLDTMLFFVSLEDILGPLVNTLDTWQMHDEQGKRLKMVHIKYQTHLNRRTSTGL